MGSVNRRLRHLLPREEALKAYDRGPPAMHNSELTLLTTKLPNYEIRYRCVRVGTDVNLVRLMDFGVKGVNILSEMIQVLPPPLATRSQRLHNC